MLQMTSALAKTTEKRTAPHAETTEMVFGEESSSPSTTLKAKKSRQKEVAVAEIISNELLMKVLRSGM